LILCLALLLSFGAARAQAFPMLQLDIVGGYYDPVTQTIISSGPDFTLVALLTPQNNSSAATLTELLNDTYFISAAVIPSTGPGGSTLGSFTFNSANYDVTGDLTYGNPPIELFTDAVGDPGDLQNHGVFPTYFGEFGFSFSADQRAVTYNTADAPGGFTTTTSTDPNTFSYYQTFNITTSLSDPTNAIHFDLYNTYVQNCARSGACVWDEEIALFAPFSHDAQSRVPEPQTLVMMSTGLLIAGRLLARRRKA